MSSSLVFPGDFSWSNLFERQQPQSTFEVPLTVEEYVEAFYADTPDLVEVARCESHFRQFTDRGDILRGRVNPADVGVMQINERFHKDKAKELGYNLYTLEGNLLYAKYLYDEEGTTPWRSSSICWESKIAKK